MLLEHTVLPSEDGLTLRELMRGPLGLSTKQLQNLKAEGAVTVDAAPFFTNQQVRTGMVVRLILSSYSPTRSTQHTFLPQPLRILFEDEALIAVHKPALLQCHPSSSAPNGSDTLESRVQSYLNAPAHPVHRLDAETTGIVLLAKLPYAQAKLQKSMQDDSFHKTYHAWVCGIPTPPNGTIDAPIARRTPDSFTRIVRSDGQRAVSRYRVLKTLTAPNGSPLSLVELSPLTGRTHQLRVHMAHIGCPLLGDVRYGTSDTVSLSASLGIAYHQLCAVSLSFLHPITNETIRLNTTPDFSFNPHFSNQEV